MAGTFCTMTRHGTDTPVVEHKVNIAVTYSRGIELDQDVIGAWYEQSVPTAERKSHIANRFQEPEPSEPLHGSLDLHLQQRRPCIP